MAIEYGELKQAYSEMLFCWQDITTGDWRRDDTGKTAEFLFLLEKWGKKEDGVWNTDEKFRYKVQETKKPEDLKQEMGNTNEEKKKTDRFYGSRSLITIDAFSRDGEQQNCLGAGHAETVF